MIGKLKLRFLRKQYRCAVKIQTRVRIRIARKVLLGKLKFKNAAVKIQSMVRGKLARNYRKNIVMNREKALNKAVTTIQKWGRRLICQVRYAILLSEVQHELDEDGDPIPPPPISSWIHTYGYDEDPDYRLKRNRRLVQNTFNRLLKKKYFRLTALRFGAVYVDQYPTVLSQEERMSEELLCEHSDFVSVFIPSCTAKHQKKSVIFDNIKQHEYRALIHIPTSANLKSSVVYYVILLQCLARMRSAWKQRKLLIRCTEAFAKFQRRFRLRSQKQHHAVRLVLSSYLLLHMAFGT